MINSQIKILFEELKKKRLKQLEVLHPIFHYSPLHLHRLPKDGKDFCQLKENEYKLFQDAGDLIDLAEPNPQIFPLLQKLSDIIEKLENSISEMTLETYLQYYEEDNNEIQKILKDIKVIISNNAQNVSDQPSATSSVFQVTHNQISDDYNKIDLDDLFDYQDSPDYFEEEIILDDAEAKEDYTKREQERKTPAVSCTSNKTLISSLISFYNDSSDRFLSKILDSLSSEEKQIFQKNFEARKLKNVNLLEERMLNAIKKSSDADELPSHHEIFLEYNKFLIRETINTLYELIYKCKLSQLENHTANAKLNSKIADYKNQLIPLHQLEEILLGYSAQKVWYDFFTDKMNLELAEKKFNQSKKENESYLASINNKKPEELNPTNLIEKMPNNLEEKLDHYKQCAETMVNSKFTLEQLYHPTIDDNPVDIGTYESKHSNPPPTLSEKKLGEFELAIRRQQVAHNEKTNPIKKAFNYMLDYLLEKFTWFKRVYSPTPTKSYTIAFDKGHKLFTDVSKNEDIDSPPASPKMKRSNSC